MVDEPALAEFLSGQAILGETAADPPAGQATEPLGQEVEEAEPELGNGADSDRGPQVEWGQPEPISASDQERQFYTRVMQGLDPDKVSNRADPVWAHTLMVGLERSLASTCNQDIA